ncbi:ectoine/hydroxyectoine ABC transporter permease subunit EhuC [Aurantimonas aggregata]|uniref:Ectoine/hydroxyectoine ABC transporter permease subunit EhuC n=1 Tax=Aurantimonas aggregata TaxID=2047720 RepID=A0A6L9MF76_9HYPH|nr:ectoine/hydroxyectoine ABC transporter permease subunit EhuC [Aurantimonas aggregata]NDV86212.1 ectoine/hydroxyectoine ABC transporter permease subunit EhuC [Aurantimonas aggregata]
MEWLAYLGPLSEGALVTAQIAVASMLLGAAFAFIFGIGKLSRVRAIRWLSVSYIEIFRGTSLLVQLFWLYFALPLAGEAVGIDLRFDPVTVGILALALNIGAYGAEVVRGALQAVHGDQFEAARALNFTDRQAMWRIALPQAIPEMMPTFGNLAIQNLKDTALVSLISLADLAFRAEQIRNFTQDSVTVYSLVLLMYFGMALVLSGFMKLLERSVGRWRRTGA